MNAILHGSESLQMYKNLLICQNKGNRVILTGRRFFMQETVGAIFSKLYCTGGTSSGDYRLFGG